MFSLTYLKHLILLTIWFCLISFHYMAFLRNLSDGLVRTWVIANNGALLMVIYQPLGPLLAVFYRGLFWDHCCFSCILTTFRVVWIILIHVHVCTLYVDDTTLITTGFSLSEIILATNSDLSSTSEWLLANKLSLNV